MSIIAKRKRGRPRKHHSASDHKKKDDNLPSELQLARVLFFKEYEQFKKTFPCDNPFTISGKEIDLFLLDKYIKETTSKEDIWNILPEKFSISIDFVDAPALFRKLYEQQKLREFSIYRSQVNLVHNSPKNLQPQPATKISRFTSKPLIYPQSVVSNNTEDSASRLDILKSISLDHFQGTDCRIFKALESGFPNEIDWALYQSVRLSSVIDTCSLHPQSSLPRQVLQTWRLLIKNDFLSRLFVHSNPFFQSIHMLFSYLQSNILPKAESALFLSCSEMVHSLLDDITHDTDIYGLITSKNRNNMLFRVITSRMLQITTILHHCTLLPEEDVKWMIKDHCCNMIRQYLMKFFPLIRLYSMVSTLSQEAVHWEPFYRVLCCLFSTSWIECIRIVTETTANIASVIDIYSMNIKFVDPFLQMAVNSNELGMITSSLDILTRLSLVNGDILTDHYKGRFGTTFMHSRWIELLISPVKKVRLAIVEFIFQYMNVGSTVTDGMEEFIHSVTPVLFYVLLDELQYQGKMIWLKQLKEMTIDDQHPKPSGLGTVHIAIRWIMTVSGYQVGNMHYHDERIILDDLYKEYTQFCKKAVDNSRASGGSVMLSQRELVQVFAQVFPGCIPSRQYWTIPQSSETRDTLYVCRWNNCPEKTNDLRAFIQHIMEHNDKDGRVTSCSWNGCTKSIDTREFLEHMMTHVLTISDAHSHEEVNTSTENTGVKSGGTYALPSFLCLKRKAAQDHHGSSNHTKMNDICHYILHILAKISGIPSSENPFISQDAVKKLFCLHMDQLATYWSFSNPQFTKPLHIIFDNLASLSK